MIGNNTGVPFTTKIILRQPAKPAAIPKPPDLMLDFEHLSASELPIFRSSISIFTLCRLTYLQNKSGPQIFSSSRLARHATLELHWSITLLCRRIEVLQNFLLPKLNHHLTVADCLSTQISKTDEPHQPYSFQLKKWQQVSINKIPHRALLIVEESSKAFDTVDHTQTSDLRQNMQTYNIKKKVKISKQNSN